MIRVLSSFSFNRNEGISILFLGDLHSSKKAMNMLTNKVVLESDSAINQVPDVEVRMLSEQSFHPYHCDSCCCFFLI